LLGLIALLIVLLVREPRDTVVLEISAEADPNQLSVWVAGEVAQPGLYTLPRGSRVADAVAAAGGAEPGADTSTLGMAAVLEDADQIFVPALDAGVTPGGPQATASNPDDGSGGPSSGLVNINTASALDLEGLPGIGPVLAQRIVDYRLTNGPFQDVGELEAVQGISARMVEELEPLITLGP
jgi:competence protein ComEA